MEEMVRNISIGELQLFSQVNRLRSLRSVARANHWQPSYVSKVIKRLENKLGIPLLKRSSAGVALTREGLELIDVVNGILESAEALRLNPRTERAEKVERRIVTVGAVHMINKFLVAPLLGHFEATFPKSRFRLLDIGPDEIVPSGLKGSFESTVYVGRLSWTRSWTSVGIGSMAWVLVGQSRYAPREQCGVSEIRRYSFVVPTYWNGEKFAVGNDYCPLPWRDRVKGNEASSADCAMEIVRQSRTLAFIPKLVAKTYLQRGELVEIRVKGWKTVEQPVYLAVRSDRVPNLLYRFLATTLQENLERLA